MEEGTLEGDFDGIAVGVSDGKGDVGETDGGTVWVGRRVGTEKKMVKDFH